MRFFSAIRSRQHGFGHNFGQNFPRKCSKENFGKIIESQVSWRKYQKDSTKNWIDPLAQMELKKQGKMMMRGNLVRER